MKTPAPTLRRGSYPGFRGARPKPRSGHLAALRVAQLPGQRDKGRLVAGSTVMRCALGPAGILHDKREGDGATPAGRFRLSTVLVRSDRIGHPATGLRSRPIARQDGWCDDMQHALYNRPVRRPFTAGHEALWRDDHLYDCIVAIEYNTRQIRRGRGSAIFLHVAAPGLTPTAGCVAIPKPAMLRLLARLSCRTWLIIG